MKSRGGKSQRREEKRIEEEKKEDQKRESLRRKKIQVREKVGKSRNAVVFPMICGSRGGSLKRQVRSPLGRSEKKNCTRCGTKHFQVKMYKTHHVRITFGSWDVEKLHAVVARSTFPSQNVQNTRSPDHFWKLRCRKSARRCGGKHIFKSKCTKHTIPGPRLEVEMSKICMPLWHEAHFEVKLYKTREVQTTFGSWDVQKLHAVVARSTFRSQNVKNTICSVHVWKLRCRFAWQAQGIVHLVKSEKNLRVLWHLQLQPPLHHTTLQYTTLQLQLHLHYIPLHYTTLHHTTLHYITLRYTTFHYTTLHYTTLQLHYIPLHYYTPLHYTQFRYTTLHYTTLHSTTTTTTSSTRTRQGGSCLKDI